MTLFFSFVALFTASLFGAYTCHRVSGWWGKRKRRRRFAHGIRAEGRAEKMLEKMGYHVYAVQPSVEVSLSVDGEAHRYQIRPDLLVQKQGKRYVAEVKTGRLAPNPLFKETRRQLLEYSQQIGLDGVLLVNPDTAKVSEITFGTDERERRHSLIFIMGALIGAGGMYVFIYAS